MNESKHITKVLALGMGILLMVLAASVAQAGVTLVGTNGSTSSTTWLTDGLVSEGGINYQISIIGNFAYGGAGAQSQSGTIALEWPTAGTIDPTMGQALGGGLNWTGTPSAGDTLVWQGIAAENGVYAIVNAADKATPAIIAANKITLTAGQIATWVDSDPTNGEQYWFLQVDDASNTDNGGLVGSWGAAIVNVPPPDTTPPLWVATWPQVDTPTGDGATARAQIDEDGTAYYVVVADGAGAPSSAQVKAGQDSGGGAALASGSIALSASTEGTDAFSGLSASTAYDVYFVAEDDEGTPNIQASPVKVDFTTTTPDTTAPSWEATYPQVETETGAGATARAQIDEAGTAYYVVVADGAGTPSSAQVKAGQDSGGGAALASGSIALSASTEGTDAFSGLSASTAYDVYFVAQDDEGTPNIQASPVKVDFTTVAPVGWVVGVDFGGTPPGGGTDPVNNFNAAKGLSGTIAAGSMIDTNNAVVAGLSLSWSGGLWNNNDSADSTDLPGQPGFFDDSNLTDWIGENAGAPSDLGLTFSGLDDTFSYELVIGSGFVAGGTDTDTEWTADGQSGTSVHDSGPDAYVTLANLSTDGSGNLAITSEPAGAANFTLLSALRLTAIPPDTTPPSWVATWPQVDTVTTDGATARAQIDEGGTAYYVVVADGAGAPSSAQVKAGQDSGGGAALASGSIALTASTEGTDAFSGLSAGTAYDVYFVAEDDAGSPNLQASPVKVDFTTLASDTTPPTWVATWPQVDTETTNGATARAQIDENGTAYYVVVADGDGAPSSAQVKAGQDSGGGAALASGSIALSASTEGTDAFSGLSDGTAYDVYFVAEDDEGTPNIQASPTLVAFTTTVPIAIGTVIGVDFGPTVPVNSFNNAATASDSIASGSMIDTNGALVADVGFSWSGGGVSDASLTESELPGQPAVFDDSNLTDWLIQVGGPGLITLTFTNLDDSMKYDLLIGSGFGDDNPNCTWTADGESDTIDSNVGADAFVTLVNLSTDGSGNLVITSAGVAPRTDISVVSALTLTAKEADTTPPTWIATWPQVDTETIVGATARAQTDEAGTAYYVVLADGAGAPSSAQVKAGTDASDAAALASGSIVLSTATEGTDAFNGLTQNTAYDVYYVAEDDEGPPNVQASPVLVEFTTASLTPLAVGMVIGIDLGPTTSANWNNFNADGMIGAGFVVDLTGAAIDAVSVTVSGAGYGTGGSDGWAESPAGSLPDVPDSATTDIGVGGAGGILITISNLSPSAYFDLDAVTVAAVALNRQDTITVTGKHVYSPSTILRQDSHNNGQYHSLNELIPTAGGVLTIVVTDVSGNNNPICNMLRLEVIPTPKRTLFMFN